jgi:hypothetical protein
MDSAGSMGATGRFQRYAIYWTPQPGSGLAAFGEAWFGPKRQTYGLEPELVKRAIKAPSRYGLHATLKAPFRLREGASEGDLQQALDAFCSKRRAPSGGALKLAQFQRYLGLVLDGKTAGIDWLADECVTHFDRFRAPFDQSDRDRRAHAILSAAEEAFLQNFGYPFVLSEFQFHLSLAGPLEKEELEAVAEALRPHLQRFMAEPLKIDGLSLLGERADGMFEIVSRHPFLW